MESAGGSSRGPDTENSLNDVRRALKDALDESEEPAVTLADVVEESDYSRPTVSSRLKELAEDDNSQVMSGSVGSATAYWWDKRGEAIEKVKETRQKLAEEYPELSETDISEDDETKVTTDGGITADYYEKLAAELVSITHDQFHNVVYGVIIGTVSLFFGTVMQNSAALPPRLQEFGSGIAVIGGLALLMTCLNAINWILDASRRNGKFMEARTVADPYEEERYRGLRIPKYMFPTNFSLVYAIPVSIAGLVFLIWNIDQFLFAVGGGLLTYVLMWWIIRGEPLEVLPPVFDRVHEKIGVPLFPPLTGWNWAWLGLFIVIAAGWFLVDPNSASIPKRIGTAIAGGLSLYSLIWVILHPTESTSPPATQEGGE